MNPIFDEIYTSPENQVFHTVFFPDRIYHARYLNATRSSRYRYNTTEVRGKADAIIMKGQVYLDGKFLSNFIRIEHKASRLLELVRENNRFLGESTIAWVKLHVEGWNHNPETRVKLHYCEWIKGYQVEIWDTLESPFGSSHDIKVLDLIGKDGEITRVKKFTNAIKDLSKIKRAEIAFREAYTQHPTGWGISEEDAEWDNYFGNNNKGSEGNIQVPNNPNPNSHDDNTIRVDSYLLDFQRAFVMNANEVDPVRYENGMMDDHNPECFDGNIIEMKWLLQRELGGNLVFFHEVTIPANAIEGTHRHIGSEELYYITEGEGVAYVGEGDDPSADVKYPTVNTSIYGLEKKDCKEVPVSKGSVIYTKSGGIHGIRNPKNKPLKFVAFLYHSA
ncbi:cupin domain-containing protein [Persicobacter diffluens]|uniref:Cupin type-1 domain-containing protein n=1 Tax=Persicobacter diffluens TaxID=981 RepID=A0AAN4W5D2_9BACT|nr:hypothetical protein PEDI_54750 [Persicobacter diffluens]